MSLAPAYRIVKAASTIEFVPGQNPELRVVANYTLENYGTTVLSFVNVMLPSETRYAVSQQVFKVNGQEVNPVKVSAGTEEETSQFRVPVDPGWNPKERCDLHIQYTFSPNEAFDVRVAVAAASFRLISPGWLPALQPPNHVLSSAPSDPDRTIYSVKVPADFLVLASGKSLGRKKDGDAVAYRFELRKNDLPPYVVAGRYVDSSSNRGSSDAHFWTFEPLKEDPAPAEKQIAAVSGVLQKTFLPLQKDYPAPHLVESSGLPAADPAAPQAVSFPAGVLLNSQAIALGIDSPAFSKLAARGLAGALFANISSSASPIGISGGLPEYAGIVVDEALNGQGVRREHVLSLLREYDDACKEAVEKPLIATTMQDPVEQRRIALAKGALFFIALEDAYGEEPIRQGLGQVLTLLRGQQVGYPDIRAAIEYLTKKDLAPVFRTWVYKPGIPQDFRERSMSANAANSPNITLGRQNP